MGVGAGISSPGMGIVFNDCPSNDMLVQQRRQGWTGGKGRLRREDCKFVKHDKLFSKWKILVGPSDSAEHINSAGKDGTCKYHIHNLPAMQSGPGVYELGVTAPSWSKQPTNQRNRTLKRENVIPVYIGQAANIRLRLQKYALAGAHLEPGSRSPKRYGDNDSVGSTGSPRRVQSGFREEVATSAGSGPRLFSDVLALGSCIAFRWAQTDSKVVAEQVESELLAVFDYAWNKGASGTRRSRDILAKLFMAWPTKGTFFRNLMCSSKRLLWLLCERRKAVGIKVALRKPQDTITSTNSSKTMTATGLCFSMTMRSRGPIKVVSSYLKCGVVTGNAPPLRGRRRCLHHHDINRVRGSVAPGSPSPNPSASTTLQLISMGRVKPRTDSLKAKRISSPNGLLGREPCFAAVTQTLYCKIAEAKDETKPVDSRRRNSLSFNTWMKGDTDQRVHDNSDVNESTYPFQKPAMTKQYSSKRRVRHLGTSKYYAPVPDDDRKRR